MKVNVGTIGHIDHGKSTLTAALVKVLGKEMANQVVIVTPEDADEFSKNNPDFDGLAVSPIGSSTPSNAKRKDARKARMLAAQRRAFFGETAPSRMP